MNFHQTEAHGRFLESIGWRVIKHRFKGVETRYFLKSMPLVPIHFLKIQRLPEQLIDWQWVEQIKQKYRVWETVIELDEFKSEPIFDDQSLRARGFKPAKDYMLTTKTRVIELTLDETELLSQMKPKTRYNLHKAERNGLKPKIVGLELGKEEEYYQLLRENAHRIGMLLLPKAWIKSQWQAFNNQGFLVEVRTKEGELGALATFYTSATDCSYNLNGSTAAGRQLFAPTLAIWQGMIEAKKRGLVLLDFDGVYDERYPKSQRRFKGFGRFKAGFGGKEVYYPPMYRKWSLK